MRIQLFSLIDLGEKEEEEKEEDEKEEKDQGRTITKTKRGGGGGRDLSEIELQKFHHGILLLSKY